MNIKQYLEKYKITQSELAKKAGVSQATISRLVNDDDYNPGLTAWKYIVIASNGKITRR